LPSSRSSILGLPTLDPDPDPDPDPNPDDGDGDGSGNDFDGLTDRTLNPDR
jgi:hypothetical protein